MTLYGALTGVGSYLPERILTNTQLESMIDTSDEWIVTRTGIRERRLAAPDESTSDLAARACEAALADSGLALSDIDLLIVGTSSPDMIFPSTACLTAAKVGLTCPAYDVMAACTGFVFGLHSATAAIESGRARNVVVVGADAITRHVDFTDRATCVLFGDGAGAVVVSASEQPGILGVVLGSDGTGADLLKVPATGSAAPATHELIDAHEHHLKMNGNEVFKFAVRAIPKATEQALAVSGLSVDQLAWLIPHQANQRIISTIGERLGIPDTSVFSNVERTGNTSAASIPLALDELYTSGRLHPGDHLALVGFGAGLTWGAAIVTWTKPTTNTEA